MLYCDWCALELHADHVILITTRHTRHFCHIECLVHSYQEHLDAVYSGLFDKVVM